MKKIKVKQGTLAWEKLRAERIGGSEIFDVVRYYASDDELQNCGVNAEDFRSEKPYTTAWALYHKILNDGLYKKEALSPELAEYGHAAEPYGVYILQKDRKNKLHPGEVYIDNLLIASLDISGTAEEIDVRPFDFGNGMPKPGQKFVCEQKTMMPSIVKKGVPFKYIIQAQYQIMMTKADFFILQIMVLKEDTPFIRGRITEMTKKKRCCFLNENMTVKHLYFQNNQALAELIKACIVRFFEAVKNKCEPVPFIEYDSQRNIIEAIRLNSLYNDEKVCDYDLSSYIKAKDDEDTSGLRRKAELQKIVEAAMQNNACKFLSPDGSTAKFSKSGSFLVSEVVL